MEDLSIRRGSEDKRIVPWVPLLLLCVMTGCHRTWSIASAKKINDGDVSLYVMKYCGDYGSGDLQTGRGLKGIWKWLYDKKKSQIAAGQQADASSVGIADIGGKQDVKACMCSCFSAMDENSDRLFGRNHDWTTYAALLLFTNPSNGYASVSMVDLSWFGFDSSKPSWLDRLALAGAPYLPFDGMNECGLTVGGMSVPHADGGHDPTRETLGISRLMREMLDRAGTVDQAIAIAEKYNIVFTYGFPAHLQVSDAHGNAAVIEFLDGKTRVTQKVLPWQVCTNFIVSGKTEKESLDSCWRYNKAHTQLKQNQGYLSETSAMDLLESVSENDTSWSIVYEQSSGRIRAVTSLDYEQVYEFQLGMRDKPGSETIMRPIPPSKATRPIPGRGAGQAPGRKPILKWKAGKNAKSHKVYFGTDRHSLRCLGNVTSPKYTGLSELQDDVTYYWRVDEVLADESTVKGDIWSFTKGKQVAWWTFDGHAQDQSPQAHHGTTHGTPQWVSGISNQAVALEKEEDYIVVQPMKLSTSTITITLWVKTEEVVVNPGLVFSRDGSTCTGLWLGRNNDLRYCWNGARGTWSWDSDLLVPNQTWTFTALTIDSEKATIYMHDGKQMKSAAHSYRHGEEEFDGITNIGHDPRWGTIKGAIDEVRIYNYALDAAQIEAIYLETQKAP